MKDQNIVFALESERRKNIRIHDRPAARALWAQLCAEGDKKEAACLVTGERGPIARLHPAIKGVWGAQTSGASIVSFNLDAFTSYGHEQGENAPVSEAAAFAYTTALNRFLEKGSGHRIQIGDASTVFWADASDAKAAQEAEGVFAGFCSAPTRSTRASRPRRSGRYLKAIREGRPIADFKPELAEGVRFFVLGLAPNAARLSVRFYLEDDFGAIADRFLRAPRAHAHRAAAERRAPVHLAAARSKRRRSARSREYPAQSRRRMAAGDPDRRPLSSDAALHRSDAAARRPRRQCVCASPC